MSEHLPPGEHEISDEEKYALIERVSAMCPYEGQPVDRFGAYETRFLLPEAGYVSVYIPGLHGADIDDLIDDAVQIMERVPEPLNDDTTLVKVRSYKIHLDDMRAEYTEDTKAFDTATDMPVGERVTELIKRGDIRELIESVKFSYEFDTSTVFTPQRLTEVNAILDSLDPDDKYWEER